MVLGGVMVVMGSDFAVSGATEIARFFGMSERFIGLTIVAFEMCIRDRTCKADQGKKSSGFQKFIIKWKRDCFISAVKLRWGNIKTSFYG